MSAPWVAETLLLGLSALVLYALLGQQTFYKTDGPDLVRMLHEGNLRHPWHVGYLPLLDAFRATLRAVGLEFSLVRLGALFSAGGAALAVAAFHAGTRALGASRPTALAATALLALNPGVVLFATVVEFHGPALGAVGLAWWWACRTSATPSLPAALVLGVLTHGAFLMHSSNLFLPALLLPWLVAMRWGEGTLRRDLGLVVVAGAVHTALFVAMPKVFPGAYGDYADLGAAFAREASTGRPQTIDWLPVILLQEWLWPLLPLSVSWLVAWRFADLRPAALALCAGLAPYLYLCVRQLVHEPERGAYMLPLLLPAAALSARSLPRAVVIALAVGSGVAACWGWGVEQAAGRRVYHDAVLEFREAAAGGAYFAVVGRHDEMATCYAVIDPADFAWIRPQASMPREQCTEQVLAATRNGLLALHASGRALLLTAGARASLQDPAAVMRSEKATADIPPTDRMAGPLFLADLEQHFEFVAGSVRADGTVGVWRLVPRKR
ncbi:MAG: hypothetical protein RL148_1552 [Planctomycetota bacterium]